VRVKVWGVLGQLGRWVLEQLRTHSIEVDTVVSPALDISSFGGFEIAYRRATTDEDVISQSLDHDIYFAGVPVYRPAKDHVIIDAVAHIGTFSLLAASKVPKGHVYAIEASRETFNLLRINVALNQAFNIDLSHLALSDKPGTSTLYHDTGHWGHTTVKPIGGYGEIVATDSLANFLAIRKPFALPLYQVQL
jgi:hypothetical protein